MTAFVVENLCELTLSTPGFDDLSLTGETTDGDGHTYAIQACDEETTWGNPVPVDNAVQRWMTDGAVASTQGHENREISFKVIVSAGTSVELAVGEAALALRANRSGLLAWTPPEGDSVAAASVFEVWTWHLAHTFDGMDERRLQRVYTLTMTAKPWVRSADPTQVDALPTSDAPTVTPIDNCESLTGWTGSPNAPVLSGTGLTIHESKLEIVNAGGGSPTSATVTRSLTRTGSVTGLASTPLLVIDAGVSGGVVKSLGVSVGGASMTRVAQVGTSYYYRLPAGVTSFTSLKITTTVFVTTTGTVTLTVGDVSATDVVGGIGSHKQFARSLDVGGSVPSSGSIQVGSPDSTPLGTVMVYSCTDPGNGYTPPLRPYRTSGNTTSADTTAVSGFHEALVNAGTPVGDITYTVPASTLVEGTYAIVGRFLGNSVDTLTATVTAAVEGYSADSVTGKVALPVATTWTWGVVGAMTLPPQMLPDGSQLNVVITLSGDATGTVTMDELFLVDVTHGALSLVDCGDDATLLWLDAPDADPVRNRPAVYIGTADDRSDAAGAPGVQVLSLGDHDLNPSGAVLFTVTDSVDDALVSASFYQRWHTHAGA